MINKVGVAVAAVMLLAGCVSSDSGNDLVEEVDNGAPKKAKKK